MGDIFSRKRFRKYLGFEFCRTLRQHSLTTALFGLIPLLVFLMTATLSAVSGSREWSINSFTSETIATATSVLYFLFIPILCYGEATDKVKGRERLMLPVSHTEKFLSMFLIGAVIFPAIFSIIYVGCDWILYSLFPGKIEKTVASMLHEPLMKTTEHSFYITSLVKFFLPFMVSSAGLCGAVLFKKSKMVKTFITSAVSFLLLYYLLGIIFNVIDCDADTWIRICSMYGYAFWTSFQITAGLCCLAYVYFRTKRIEL